MLFVVSGVGVVVFVAAMAVARKVVCQDNYREVAANSLDAAAV